MIVKEVLVVEGYKRRIADSILARKLQSSGAVLIEGPKWCGKTTTAEQMAKSVVYINDPSANNLERADVNLGFLLEGETPHLLDEWQLIPEIWDAVRFEVDHRKNGFGQFILTGSAVPLSTDKILHTGTGRFSRLRMRPMSLYESEDSSGEVSLEALFRQEQIGGINRLDFARLAFLLCRGGWPSSLALSDEASFDVVYNYVDSIITSDISRADNVSRDRNRALRLLQAYARAQSTQTTVERICKDIAANDAEITRPTVCSYLSALRKIFVVEDVAAWNPNLRSKTAIQTSDTRYFVDPSIAIAALSTGPEELMKAENLKLFGQLFETMCIRDLRIYAETIRGEIRHYRDRTGLECDAVLHKSSGEYALIEIKLGGGNAIEYGAENLNKLAAKIQKNGFSAPAFLMVLSGTERYAYRRKDGIYVVPVGCLKN